MRHHQAAVVSRVVDFVKRAGESCRLAIASGGRREQIQFALQGTPIDLDRKHVEIFKRTETTPERKVHVDPKAASSWDAYTTLIGTAAAAEMGLLAKKCAILVSLALEH